MDGNEGLEHRFYVPKRYWAEFNRIVYANGLDKFEFRTLGVPLGTAKSSDHTFVDAKCTAIELGYDSPNA